MRNATPRRVFIRASIATLALGIAVLCNLFVTYSSQALGTSSNDSNKATLKSTSSSKKQKNQPVPQTAVETPSPKTLQPLPQPLATALSLDVDELTAQRLASTLTPLTGAVTLSSIKAFTPKDHSFALLRPTDQGWKILGVLWYWWTPGIVVAWVLFSRMLARAIRVHELKKVVAS